MTFDAGSIVGSLKLDISEFSKGMIESESLMQAFPPILLEFMENPMLAAIEVMKEAAESFADIIGEVARHAQEVGLDATRAGTTVKWFDDMAAAANVYGVSQDGLTMGMQELGRNAADALSGVSKEAREAFGAIGISMDQLRELMNDPAALFDAVRDGIGGLATAGEKSAAAQELMSRSGRQLLPLLEAQKSDIADIIEVHRRLGAEEDDASVRMGQKWAKISQAVTDAWEGIKKKLAEPILDYLTAHMDQLLPLAYSFADAVGKAIPLALEAMKIATQLAVPELDALLYAFEAVAAATDKLDLTKGLADSIEKAHAGMNAVAEYLSKLPTDAAEPPGEAGASSRHEGALPIAIPPISDSMGYEVGGIGMDLPGGTSRHSAGAGGAQTILQETILSASPQFYGDLVNELRPMLWEVANAIENAIEGSSAGNAASDTAASQTTSTVSRADAAYAGVQIEHLNVAGIDPTMTADRIAQRIAPQIRSAIVRQQRAAESAASRIQVEAAVAGKGD